MADGHTVPVAVCSARTVWVFFQAEDGIRDLVGSRWLGDVYKRQAQIMLHLSLTLEIRQIDSGGISSRLTCALLGYPCLLYTSDAADERSRVDLVGRRLIKKKNKEFGPEGTNLDHAPAERHAHRRPGPAVTNNQSP